MKPVFIKCWLLSCTFGVYWVWQFYFWLNFSVSSVSMSLGESCFYRSTCMTLVGSERAPPGSANVFLMYPVFFIHSTKQTVFEISFFSSTWRSVNSFTLFFFYFLFLVYFRLFLLSQVSPRQLSSFFFFFSFWLELHLQTFSLRLTLIIQQLGLDFVVRFEESWRDYVSELKSLPWTGLKCSLISVLLK